MERPLSLQPEDAVRLGLFWSAIMVEPEDAARMAFDGLDAASRQRVLRAYEADWNHKRLVAGQRH